jgi:hypothetical protein
MATPTVGTSLYAAKDYPLRYEEGNAQSVTAPSGRKKGEYLGDFQTASTTGQFWRLMANYLSWEEITDYDDYGQAFTRWGYVERQDFFWMSVQDVTTNPNAVATTPNPNVVAATPNASAGAPTTTGFDYNRLVSDPSPLSFPIEQEGPGSLPSPPRTATLPAAVWVALGLLLLVVSGLWLAKKSREVR